jgi:hypothetical protein
MEGKRRDEMVFIQRCRALMFGVSWSVMEREMFSLQDKVHS